jgi:hypothetical protein
MGLFDWLFRRGARRKLDWRDDPGGLAAERDVQGLTGLLDLTPHEAESQGALLEGARSRIIPLVRAGRLEEHAAAAAEPYRIVRLNLAAAGAERIRFEGNSISVLRLVGANPEIGIRYGSPSADRVPITDRTILRHSYTEVFLDWAAIVGGAADLAFGWE